MDKMMKKNKKQKNICTLEKKIHLYIIDKQYCIAQHYTEMNSPLLLSMYCYIVENSGFTSK